MTVNKYILIILYIYIIYYGQFNPQVDQVLHTQFFPDKFNGISIECGSFDGITDSCTKFFEEKYKNIIKGAYKRP
jgi:hypothetical protein